MASGQTLAKFHPYQHTPSAATNYPTLSYRNFHPHLEFDQSTDEACNFTDVLSRHYDNGGLTINVWFSVSGVTTGNVAWEIAIERIADGVQDIDSDGFAAVQTSGAVAVPSTDGYVTVAAVTFANGSEMDSLAAGELYRIKINRDTGIGSNAAADAELHFIEVIETVS